jgi:hypothetical protein
MDEVQDEHERDLRLTQGATSDESARADEIASAAWRRAFHEAGHAVVALSIGYEVELLSIKESGDLGGHAVIASIDPLIPRHEIQITLAGWIGEWLANDRMPLVSGRESAKGDDASVDALVAGMLVAPQREAVFRAECSAAAERILVERWAAVTAIATELVDHGTIDGVRVQKIVEGFMPSAARAG